MNFEVTKLYNGSGTVVSISKKKPIDKSKNPTTRANAYYSIGLVEKTTSKWDAGAVSKPINRAVYDVGNDYYFQMLEDWIAEKQEEINEKVKKALEAIKDPIPADKDAAWESAVRRLLKGEPIKMAIDAYSVAVPTYTVTIDGVERRANVFNIRILGGDSTLSREVIRLMRKTKFEAYDSDELIELWENPHGSSKADPVLDEDLSEKP